MTSVTIEEAQARLKEIIHRLSPGEEILITENHEPVARLVSEQARPTPLTRPGPGLCKGIISYIAPDFDAPLDDMRD